MNNKFKNVGLWISVAALIPMVFKGFNINILPVNYNEIVNTLLGILILAGILNNPSNGSGYTDNLK